jgi:hypothetical protein
MNVFGGNGNVRDISENTAWSLAANV